MQGNIVPWLHRAFRLSRITWMPVAAHSKRARKKQAIRDQTIYEVSSDYVWTGKQAYAFGFAATGALGLERLVLPEGRRQKHQLRGINYPVKLSHFGKDHTPTSVACGYGFTLYICKRQGSGHGVYGCGINSDGQLGQLACLEGQLETGDPVYVVPAPKAISIPLSSDQLSFFQPTHVACGRAHSIVGFHSVVSSTSMTHRPLVFGLGNNTFGQCGRQIIENEVFGPETSVVSQVPLPNEVNGLSQVCCGQDHSLLLSTDGVIYSAGLGSDGQTGVGHLGPVDRFTPVRGALQGLFVEQVASRGDTVLALTRCGRLFAWGNNEYGQIWTAGDNLQVSEPLELPLDKCIVPVEAGEPYNHVKLGRLCSIACAGSMCSVVNEEGYVFVWGFGCLGLGPTTTFAALPTLIPPGLFNIAQPGTGTRVVSVTSGLHHFVVRTANGLLWAWGAPRGGLYCLGLGATVTTHAPKQTYPMPLSLPAEVKDVACGVDHTIVLARSLA